MLYSKSRNKLLILLTTLVLLVGSNSLSFVTSQIEISIPAIESEFTFTLLDELPISLEDLFSLDNFTNFEQMLDSIEAGTSFWPIRPYGTFFGHGHPEGLARMDFCPHEEHVEIRAPVDASLEWYLALNGSIDIINGYECVMDSSLTLDLGNECWLNLGHIDMLKTVWDEIEATGNLNLTKGELLGFTYSVYSYSILDFSYYFKGIAIPPHYAFTPKLLGKVEVLFDFLYERAKINGLYPRARMINEMNIHKDDEFWGNWFYKTGPYDSYKDPEEHISAYDFGVLTFLNREFTSQETYWKDQINPVKNLTSDVLGVGRNCWESSTPGYKAIGDGQISLAEGDNTSGIMEFRIMTINDYGPINTSVFGKFEMIVNSTSVVGDELQIEFFPTLEEAQSGFTTNVSTYYRIYTPTLDDIVLPLPTTTTTPTTEEGVLFLYPTLFCIILVYVIIRKKNE